MARYGNSGDPSHHRPAPVRGGLHTKCSIAQRSHMAFIPYIPEEDASPELRELYRSYGRPDGGLDNILRIHSLSPASMKGHRELYRILMYGDSPLSRAQREMIAVTVSSINDCFY